VLIRGTGHWADVALDHAPRVELLMQPGAVPGTYYQPGPGGPRWYNIQPLSTCSPAGRRQPCRNSRPGYASILALSGVRQILGQGFAFFQLRRFAQAIPRLLEAIDHHPTARPMTSRILAACYAYLGRVDEAPAIPGRSRARFAERAAHDELDSGPRVPGDP
jgi:hypothetical protein